jgi:hypothetical protein
MAGGPAVSTSPALIHPEFNFFTGTLSSAAITTDHSLGISSRGYALQPPISVLTSALPLLKLQRVESASSPLWPDEGTTAGTTLALVQGVWNASSLQHVFSLTAAPMDAAVRAQPFQLLHGALLATCVTPFPPSPFLHPVLPSLQLCNVFPRYYKLRADASKSTLSLSNPADAFPCMTAAASAPLPAFNGKQFPNVQCDGSAVASYAVRYHGFVRRSSAAQLTFVLPEIRSATFFAIYVDQQPLPLAAASTRITWATRTPPPPQTITAVIPPRSDRSPFHELLIYARGVPMSWPPPLPLLIGTECHHALTVVNASAGVFTTSATHALAGGEALLFEGSDLAPPLAAGTLYYVLPDSLTRYQFSVSSSRLGTSSVAAQWSGGNALVLGKCGVYAPFALGAGMLLNKHV